jgi:hypothetical protein
MGQGKWDHDFPGKIEKTIELYSWKRPADPDHDKDDAIYFDEEPVKAGE